MRVPTRWPGEEPEDGEALEVEDEELPEGYDPDEDEAHPMRLPDGVRLVSPPPSGVTASADEPLDAHGGGTSDPTT